ncbi:hypothetical protein ACX27_24060 [Nostoc piscinale CENA21]|uniref:Uncharacterized protein n=1 Tax=Nostoc piscinale CENA21 TaxID=224013 RepID=A0A0M4TXA3_9NOSO|nr:hypothetical protein ACX27_24060 [Nostoc piscinale CENA21]
MYGDRVDDYKAAANKGSSLDYPNTNPVFAEFPENKGEFYEKILGEDKRSQPQKVKLPQRLSVAKAT